MNGLDIVTCPQWGARKPRHPLTIIPASPGIIFHHTAGHHREIERPADESLEESMRYARDVQNFHMDVRGWEDSGHNFLVCRNGVVLQGRTLTVAAIEAGQMVHSAHCPDFNTWIGIEHEHAGSEKMTDAQFEASAVLQAWIAHQYGRRLVLRVDPHRAHWSTSCPANLAAMIAPIRAEAQSILSKGDF
jgi:hypothetical protein